MTEPRWNWILNKKNEIKSKFKKHYVFFKKKTIQYNKIQKINTHKCWRASIGIMLLSDGALADELNVKPNDRELSCCQQI